MKLYLLFLLNQTLTFVQLRILFLNSAKLACRISILLRKNVNDVVSQMVLHISFIAFGLVGFHGDIAVPFVAMGVKLI